MKTAEQILNNSLSSNNDIPMKDIAFLKANVLYAMKAYAEQVLDKAVKIHGDKCKGDTLDHVIHAEMLAVKKEL